MCKKENASPVPEKTGPWTEEEKEELFHRVFLYFKDGKTINWKKIDMPGRNWKSMTNMWTRLSKPVLELEARIGTPGSPSTPGQTPKNGTPAKRKATEGDDDEADEQSTPSKKPAKKRSREMAAKKMKQETLDTGDLDVKPDRNLDEYPDDMGF